MSSRSPLPPISRLTGGPVDKLFTARVLGKYDVAYYRCRDTGFIQTEEPYWLKEAYPTPIADLDVGYVQRNLYMSRITAMVLDRCFNRGARFLDYGGGCGLFVRLMRDAGYDFLRTDPFCENLFAPYFEFNPAQPSAEPFELVSAFEVLEHLPDPCKEIGEMFRLGDSILFSTEIQPDRPLNSPDDWQYFSPEHGQHVAFYTMKSLHFIAQKFNAHLHSNGASIHLLTRRQLPANPLTDLPVYQFPPGSLVLQDHEMIRTLLREPQA